MADRIIEGDLNMKWQNKLTKTELKHLRNVAGCRTLREIKVIAAGQSEMRKESDEKGLPPGIGEPCWTCYSIARKLGLR